MDRPTCETCPYLDSRYYFEPDEETGQIGYCRRRPPALPSRRHIDQHMVNEFEGIWPIVTKGDFCGEHPAMVAYAAEFARGRCDG